MTNLYPEHLEFIQTAIETLNDIDGPEQTSGIQLGRIPVFWDSEAEPIGHLIDEIGGAWCFEVAK